MAQPIPPKISFDAQLTFYRSGYDQLQEIRTEYNTLKALFKASQASPKDSNAATNALLKNQLNQCRAKCGNLKALYSHTGHPSELNSLTMKMEGKCLKLIKKLEPNSLSRFESRFDFDDEVSQDPKIDIRHAWEAFKQGKTLDARKKLSEFEEEYGPSAKNVYENLKKLKGTSAPCDTRTLVRGAQNIEIAEAIRLFCTPDLQEWLHDIVDFLKEKTTSSEERALLEFKQFQRIYPKYAAIIFQTLSQLCKVEERYGPALFYNVIPNAALDPEKRMQAIRRSLSLIEPLHSEPASHVEQNNLRKILRYQEVAKQTIHILAQGHYLIGDKRISLAEDIKRSLEQTELCSFKNSAQSRIPRFAQTTYEVRSEDCLSIAYKLTASEKVAVMNFAHPKTPGGDEYFSTGSREAALFRCTTLLPTLVDKTFYPIPVRRGIYSPNVLIFRRPPEDDYEFLLAPRKISVGSFSAVSRPSLDRTDPKNPRLNGEELSITGATIETFIEAASSRGETALVLGAFGCGLCENPPKHIAQIFMEILTKKYSGCFKSVTFAILKETAQDRPALQENRDNSLKDNFTSFAEVVKGYGGKAYGSDGEEINS